jgi:hypothetical protein
MVNDHLKSINFTYNGKTSITPETMLRYIDKYPETKMLLFDKRKYLLEKATNRIEELLDSDDERVALKAATYLSTHLDRYINPIVEEKVDTGINMNAVILALINNAEGKKEIE